jgi:hypothetical protein
MKDRNFLRITPRADCIEKRQRSKRKTPATHNADSDSATNVSSHFKRSVPQLSMIVENRALALKTPSCGSMSVIAIFRQQLFLVSAAPAISVGGIGAGLKSYFDFCLKIWLQFERR